MVSIPYIHVTGYHFLSDLFVLLLLMNVGQLNLVPRKIKKVLKTKIIYVYYNMYLKFRVFLVRAIQIWYFCDCNSYFHTCIHCDMTGNCQIELLKVTNYNFQP